MMAVSRERMQAYAPLIVLAALVFAIGLYDRSFFSSSNLLTIIADTMTLFLMASGVTFVIMIGGIDLSIQSVASMSSCVLAVSLPRFVFAAVPLAILGGTVAGSSAGSSRRSCASPRLSRRSRSAGSSPRLVSGFQQSVRSIFRRKIARKI